jgi:hypothetical protein
MQMGDTFAGIYKETHDDQLYYLARGQENVDGHTILGNAYLAEHKDAPLVQLWLPDAVLAYPLSILGISIPDGYRFYDLLIPPVVFLLTYALFFGVSQRWSASLIGTCFLWFALFFNDLSRTPSPQLNILFFLVFSLFALTAYRTNRLLFTLIAGVSFGLLFYTYFYLWTFAGALLGLLFVFDTVRLRQLARTPFVILAVGGICALPYLIGVYTASHLPYYAETLARMGTVASRTPSGMYIVATGGLLILFLLYVLTKKKITFTPELTFISAGVVAGIVATNQHLITGTNLEFSSHYLLPFSIFAIGLALFLIPVMATRMLARVVPVGIGILVLILSLVSVVKEVNAEVQITEQDRIMQGYGEVIAWLQEYAEKDDVVLANDSLMLLVPAYTHANVLAHPYAGYFYLSTKEMQDRWIIAHPETDFTDPDVVRSVDTRLLFGLYYVDSSAIVRSENIVRKIFFLPPKPAPTVPEYAIEAVTQIAQASAELRPAPRLAQYHVRYIVAGLEDTGLHTLARDAGFTPVAMLGDMTMYHKSL